MLARRRQTIRKKKSKYAFCVQNQEELKNYQLFTEKIQGRLDDYLMFLGEQYCVTSLPRAIVWTSAESATQLISDIPIPAYTNDYRTVFCPDTESWKQIYLRQLDRADNGEIRSYYETKLTENHILQILGHEFVHHSDLFQESAYERGIWFEEGMCEYISRKYFLTEEEFTEAVRINALLVRMYEDRCGKQNLEDFCTETYRKDYAAVFYAYWRSFLAVQRILSRCNNDILSVFRQYHQWCDSASQMTLSEWFGIE